MIPAWQFNATVGPQHNNTAATAPEHNNTAATAPPPQV